MDRFIASPFDIIELLGMHLKSNMDRFIEMNVLSAYNEFMHLKSNMDRFIVQKHYKHPTANKNLKSNMDRFIVFLITVLKL